MLQEPISLRAHLVRNRRANEPCDPELIDILLDLSAAAKMISREVNRAGVGELCGAAGGTNATGDDQQKLDLYAHDLVVGTLRQTGSVCGIASEEDADLIAPSEAGYASNYVVCTDPLDGSSNIDVNVTIGTIFSVYRRKSLSGPATLDDFLRTGREQVAAGYFTYSASTMLVYTTGNGVAGFTLDQSTGQFLLSHAEIRTPTRGRIYSCNEGNTSKWDEPTRKYVESLKRRNPETGRPYTARYVGSLVADFHRNLLRGGIFLYPADHSDPSGKPQGKLRLMYEANPIAMLIEQAGGAATDGEQPILDIQATDIHQRVPLIVGSRDDVEEYLSLL